MHRQCGDNEEEDDDDDGSGGMSRVGWWLGNACGSVEE